MASWVQRIDLQLRVHAGVGHNGIAPGARAGITLLALPSWISPSLTFEVGHYTRGDAQPLVDRLLGTQPVLPVLRDVGYTWGNAHAGIELGRRRVSFHLHAGLSFLHGRLRNVSDQLLTRVAADVLVYNASGTLLGRTAADVTAGPMAPGRVFDFEARFPAVYGVTSARFDVRGVGVSRDQAVPLPQPVDANRPAGGIAVTTLDVERPPQPFQPTIRHRPGHPPMEGESLQLGVGEDHAEDLGLLGPAVTPPFFLGGRHPVVPVGHVEPAR